MSFQWAATEMPKWRKNLIRRIGESSQEYRDENPGKSYVFDGWATVLLDAGLYWVSKDMTQIAINATETLLDQYRDVIPRWAGLPAEQDKVMVPSEASLVPLEIVPAPAGIINWAAPLPATAFPAKTSADWSGLKAPLPASGAMWWTRPDNTITVFATCRSDAARDALAPKMASDYYGILPIHRWDIPAGRLALPGWHPLVGLLLTTWDLMMQPTIATPRQVNGAAGSGKLGARPEQRKVTIIDLRPMKHVEVTHEPGTGREYTHRWLVSAHPRMQPYGPGRSLRRRIWVAPHIKGPAGAPLIVKERVHVWRR